MTKVGLNISNAGLQSVSYQNLRIPLERKMSGSDQLTYPVYFFEAFLCHGSEQSWNASTAQLEMIDIEVSEATDDEVSLSDYDLVKVDEYEIGVARGKQEDHQVRNMNYMHDVNTAFRRSVQIIPIAEKKRLRSNLSQAKGTASFIDAFKISIERDKLKDSKSIYPYKLKEARKESLSTYPGKYCEMDALVAKFMPHLECVVCTDLFSNFGMLKTHFLNSHRDTKPYILCCGFKLRNRAAMVTHIRASHIEDMEIAITTKHSIPSLGTNGSVSLVQNVSSKKVRLPKKRKEAIPTLRDKNDLRKIDAIIARNKVKVECGECKQTLKNLMHLRYHFFYEHPDRMYYFLCCEKRLSGYGNILAHFEFYCKRDLDLNFAEPFVPYSKEYDNLIAKWRPRMCCNLCSSQCRHFSGLKTHFRRKHPTVKCYIECCQQRLELPQQIVEHIEFHNNPTVFMCDICYKCPSSRHALFQHMCMEHSNKNNKN